MAKPHAARFTALISSINQVPKEAGRPRLSLEMLLPSTKLDRQPERPARLFLCHFLSFLLSHFRRFVQGRIHGWNSAATECNKPRTQNLTWPCGGWDLKVNIYVLVWFFNEQMYRMKLPKKLQKPWTNRRNASVLRLQVRFIRFVFVTSAMRGCRTCNGLFTQSRLILI